MNNEFDRTEELLSVASQKKKKKTLIISGIIIAIIAVGTGIFAAIMMHEGNQPSDKLMTAQKYLEEGKYEQAIKEFSEVIKLDDKNADAYEGLGMAYAKNGQFEDAKEPLRNATKNDKKNKERYIRVAKIATENDDIDFAEETLEELHKNIPDSKDVNIDDIAKDRKAYQQVLNTIMQENRLNVLDLPNNSIADGEFLDEEESYDDEYKNSFAIVDIDGDGKQELLFKAMNTTEDKMWTYVMKYDENSEKVKFIANYFEPIFYVNRDIKEEFKDGRQMEPGIDGFKHYKYNKTKDNWEMASVLKFQRDAFYSSDGQKFPTKDDKNNNGIVYQFKQGGKVEYIDDDKYPDWEKKLLSSKEVKIDYKDFTQENIDGILRTSTKPAVKKEKKDGNPNIDEALYKKIEGNWTTVGQSQRPVVIKNHKIFFYNKGEEKPNGECTIISTEKYKDGIIIYKVENDGYNWEYVMGDEGNGEDLLTYYDDYSSKEGYSMSSSLMR